MKIEPELVQILEEILHDFEGSKPEICLVPSKDPNIASDGGMIRVPTTINPEWYQRMCKDFPRSGSGGKKKKPQTIVKRKYTIVVINLLIKNLESTSKYAPYIIDEAQHRFELYERCAGFKPFKEQF